MFSTLVTSFFISFPYVLSPSIESFAEDLFVGSLDNGDLITIFNFTLLAQQNNEVNSTCIPWLFLHLFEKFSLENFKLTIAQGFWRTNLWGYQHLNTEVPSGTELSIKFSDKTENTQQKWHDFIHLINGLFCTSILGLLPQFSVQPKFNDGWWYGSLGGESVCTENLQSWKKLLPCKKTKYFDVNLPSFAINQESKNSNLMIINLNNGSSLNLNKFLFFAKDLNMQDYKHPPTILLHSFLKSVSQVGGRICIQINNPFPYYFNARFMQMLPWQIRVFLHTLTFVCSNKSKELMPFTGEYTLARDGTRPLLIELDILLPANSKCKIEFEFEAAFLKISEFPPDANSGIHVPGAVLLISQDDSPNLCIFSTFPNKTSNQKIFGEPLLILLPVPDFSMPFNVICFVCSTIAIFYGNIFALSTKLMKLFPKEEEKLKESKQHSTLTIKEKICERFYNLFSH
uniref:GPI transamidase component PIG-T n=1 Tax=Meloidogyne hapla TaxID=6305 RepID=A0A1I8BCC6_MELHA